MGASVVILHPTIQTNCVGQVVEAVFNGGHAPLLAALEQLHNASLKQVTDSLKGLE